MAFERLFPRLVLTYWVQLCITERRLVEWKNFVPDVVTLFQAILLFEVTSFLTLSNINLASLTGLLSEYKVVIQVPCASSRLFLKDTSG
jgi:hypothetical protein